MVKGRIGAPEGAQGDTLFDAEIPDDMFDVIAHDGWQAGWLLPTFFVVAAAV